MTYLFLKSVENIYKKLQKTLIVKPQRTRIDFIARAIYRFHLKRATIRTFRGNYLYHFNSEALNCHTFSGFLSRYYSTSIDNGIMYIQYRYIVLMNTSLRWKPTLHSYFISCLRRTSPESVQYFEGRSVLISLEIGWQSKYFYFFHRITHIVIYSYIETSNFSHWN